MIKYNVVCVLADYKTFIVGTFLNHRDALEALSESICQQFKKDDVKNNYKVYYESNSEITINQLGYIYGKSLFCKYFIIEFEDNSEKLSKV